MLVEFGSHGAAFNITEISQMLVMKYPELGKTNVEITLRGNIKTVITFSNESDAVLELRRFVEAAKNFKK